MLEDVPCGRKTQRLPAVKEVHVVWFTAGLGCEGDTVSVTAATQPTIEVVLLGAIRGLHKVHLQSRACLRGRRRLHELLVLGRGGVARSVRAGSGRIDSERIDQARRILGGARH